MALSRRALTNVTCNAAMISNMNGRHYGYCVKSAHLFLEAIRVVHVPLVSLC